MAGKGGGRQKASIEPYTTGLPPHSAVASGKDGLRYTYSVHIQYTSTHYTCTTRGLHVHMCNSFDK